MRGRRKKVKLSRTSLQFKLALLFFVVMLISSVISSAALIFIMRPIITEDSQNQITSTITSINRLAEDGKYNVEEIYSIINTGTVEIEKVEVGKKESGIVKKLKKSEHNVYIEKKGILPSLSGYTIIDEECFRVTVNNKENIYMIAFFIVGITLIVSTILGTLITIVASRRVLKPLRDLNIATAMVSRGMFNVKVPIPKDPEYASLINNFNKMAKDLAGIETLRGDFISNVSHEFKTPLASIQGFAKLLQDESLSDSDRREYTQIIINETSRLSKLTSDILRLSKLENQNTIVDKSRFSIDEQIRKILLVLEPEWEKKNIELDLSLDDVFYFGNEELMAQIWQNVINNAIKFTPENGHISVRLFRTEDNITAKISDDGPQIPPEIAEHIFDKFYQGDNSRKTEGNGLGLALVRRIVDLCGGKIYVENLYEGGVCFIIELPYIISDML